MYYREREDSIVTDLFTGQLLSRVVCGKCGNESIAFDNTWDFALNFNRYDDGENKTMVENFLKEETISTDYYCAKCKSNIFLIQLLDSVSGNWIFSDYLKSLSSN